MKKIVGKEGCHQQIIEIDAEDEHLLNDNWCIRKSGKLYIQRSVVDASKRLGYRTELLHRVIVSAPKGMTVDHIDGNTLNNKRNNLRICTHQQNLFNQKKPTNGTVSQWKGVGCRWRKIKQEFVYTAKIHYNGKIYYLGMFDSEVAAAKAYNTAALKYFGQFARLNNVP